MIVPILRLKWKNRNEKCSWKAFQMYQGMNAAESEWGERVSFFENTKNSITLWLKSTRLLRLERKIERSISSFYRFINNPYHLEVWIFRNPFSRMQSTLRLKSGNGSGFFVVSLRFLFNSIVYPFVRCAERVFWGRQEKSKRAKPPSKIKIRRRSHLSTLPK